MRAHSRLGGKAIDSHALAGSRRSGLAALAGRPADRSSRRAGGGCGARQLQLEGHQSAEEAEWLAKELRRLIDPKDSGRLDTVAACEAAAGQFELAIATQEAVMQLLSERFDPQSPAY